MPRSKPRRRRAALSLGNMSTRLRVGLAVMLTLFIALTGRLVQLQGLDGTAYAAQAQSNRMRQVVLAANRGEILDRSGNVLARTVRAVAVYADPGEVTDAYTEANTLAPVLGMDPSAVYADLSKATRFVYLKRGLDPSVGDRVTGLNLPGIATLPESRREVPGGNLASAVLGFTNIDGVGLAGVEQGNNSLLAGKNGSHQFELGPNGGPLPDGFDHEVPARPGTSLELTLDQDVQYVAQQTLFARAYDVGAYSASAVVMDAKTFQVLGMASYPTYDAAHPGASPVADRVNGAISDVIEPGSIHKAITIGAALQTGVVHGDSTVHIGTSITKGGKTFYDTHPHGTEDITLQGILAQSSNIGAITVAGKLGAQRLYDYQRKFGLGSPTGIGLPSESGGIVQPPANWSGPSYGGIPIGLGVAVTPLQMACAYATIANNGVRLTPSIVKGTRGPDGTYQPAAAPKQVRVLSAQNAAIEREAMSAITTNEGTGKKAAIPGYVIAGKTGTGQRTENGKYMKGNVASFIGMAPYHDPRYIVAVFVHAPDGVGGAVAAPVFHDLMSYVLRHYGVTPDAKQPTIKLVG